MFSAMSPEQPHQSGARLEDLRERERPTMRPVAPPPLAAERGTEDLASRLWTLVEGRWTIALIAGAVIAAALGYLALATPIYRSGVSVQVEDQARSLVGLEELSNVFSERAPVETEVEIIRSRKLLGGVVDDLGLDVQAAPRWLPLLGGPLARHHAGPVPASPVLGLARFAWGGERIRVDRLDVSDDVLHERLLLTAQEGGHYRLEGLQGDGALTGDVGRLVSVTKGERRIALFVSELRARPGTQFVLERARRDDVTAKLQDDLVVAEKGKKTGVLLATLDGPDPVRVAAVLKAIATSYLIKNVERKSAQASQTL
jgi:tyrosine-protein kinase Etk/Wzc